MLLALCCFPLSVWGGDYVIGEGDALDIAVWGVKELNFPVRVRPDGKITVPGLGEVVASGSTPSQLQTHLAGRLKELVKNPIVTVTVREITNSKVYIFGSGVKANVYDLSRRTTLLQLLCMLPEVKSADLKNAYLLRDGKKLKVDLHRLFIQGDTSQDLALETNDSLFVPLLTDRNVYVLGAVNTPKSVEYREGMKVMEAILEAGGFTKFADQNDVVVRRKEGDQSRSLEVKAKKLFKEGDLSQNIDLKAGDYVLVKEAFF
ncbi:polysaccharide biosynthesis/export family protein [Geomonas sp. Red69]|uniref:Polysaccharide biosynthesis/export family protein n=1 Tax=Geomonas diazotrophica TaxID=2843197 RepID=A0ABX8JWC4_9BACT|nr:polysaccharide biosynthesis/export family protein [Geomonas diazotrophica]QWV99735.1 polysaccharide biosynthesis/export family protein [Geomonas nitrogeniifigens]QXE88875.1 polysaccharide biosynthesis/export family protein [Geomonas nitrogeniifigens]